MGWVWHWIDLDGCLQRLKGQGINLTIETKTRWCFPCASCSGPRSKCPKVKGILTLQLEMVPKQLDLGCRRNHSQRMTFQTNHSSNSLRIRGDSKLDPKCNSPRGAAKDTLLTGTLQTTTFVRLAFVSIHPKYALDAPLNVNSCKPLEGARSRLRNVKLRGPSSLPGLSSKDR